MKRGKPSLAAVSVACTVTTPLSAGQSGDVHPLRRIGGNTVDSFTGANAILQAGGRSSTMVIIATDVDYEVHRYFAAHMEYKPYTEPAVYRDTPFPCCWVGVCT